MQQESLLIAMFSLGVLVLTLVFAGRFTVLHGLNPCLRRRLPIRNRAQRGPGLPGQSWQRYLRMAGHRRSDWH
jgi:hypothetical protein